MNIRVLILLIWLGMLLGLSACETQAPKDTDGLRDIIPTAERDRAPQNPKDVSAVPNAVPKVEARTIAGNKSPYKVMGIVYRVMDDPSGYEGYGIASWYGEKFQGNRTSNGEIYDMYQMTAAHKSLPIPSYVRVTNVENGKSIIVRVNDRGPFAPGRIIDLSYAGAKKLDYIRSGTAMVKVEYIDPLIYQHENPPVPTVSTPPVSQANSNTQTIDTATTTSPAKTKAQSSTQLSTVKASEISSAKYSSGNSVKQAASTTAVPTKAEVVSTKLVDQDQIVTSKSEEKRVPPVAVVSDWRAPQRYLQVGAYADESSAESMKHTVNKHTSWPVFIERGQQAKGGDIFRVHIGPFPDEQSLSSQKQALMSKGMDEPLRVMR